MASKPNMQGVLLHFTNILRFCASCPVSDPARLHPLWSFGCALVAQQPAYTTADLPDGRAEMPGAYNGRQHAIVAILADDGHADFGVLH